MTDFRPDLYRVLSLPDFHRGRLMTYEELANAGVSPFDALADGRVARVEETRAPRQVPVRRQAELVVSAEALLALLRGGRLVGYDLPDDARVCWVRTSEDTLTVRLVATSERFMPVAEGAALVGWERLVHTGMVRPRRPDVCCHCGCPMAPELNHAAWHHPDGRTAHPRCHSAWCHGLPGTDRDRHKEAMAEHLDTIVGIYGPKEDDRD